MSLPDELLDTARYLLRRNQNRPSTADVRRSISTAYYALFHRLIDDTVRHLVSLDEQQAALGREFGHTEMSNVCKLILKSPLPPAAGSFLGHPIIPPELREVAKAFLELQEWRHKADYDRATRATQFDRSEGQAAISLVERALLAWETIRSDPIARAFQLMLLLGEPRKR